MRNLISVMIFIMLTAPINGDDELIRKICKTTPNYNVCVNVIRADRRAPGADTPTLAIIMIDAIKGKSEETDGLIKQLVKSRRDLKASLEQCGWDYEFVIITTLIPQAYDGVNLRDHKYGEETMAALVVSTQYCENHFPEAEGKSPLTAMNTLVGNMSDVARAIITHL